MHHVLHPRTPYMKDSSSLGDHHHLGQDTTSIMQLQC